MDESSAATSAATASGPAADVVLSMSKITKTFGSLVANDSISLSLRKGEVLALLGENGAGKTTLMNILFGHYHPDSGDIEVFGKTLPHGSPREAIARGVGMVHQHFTLADKLTVLENITLGTESLWSLRSNKAAAKDKLESLATQFGLAINPDALVADLSVGERQRVEILKALYRDARVLILDEPTAVLTPQESERLFDTLRSLIDTGLSVIFISHKLNEVLGISDRFAVLRQGALVAEFEKGAVDKQALAEAMVGKTIPEPKRTAISAGNPVLALDDIILQGPDEQRLLNHLSLTLRSFEIVGVAGVSGNGQAALANLLSGVSKPTSGSVHLHGQPVADFEPAFMISEGVGRIPEDRHAQGVVGDLSVAENLIMEDYRHPPYSKAGVLKGRVINAHAREMIERYDIRGAKPDTNVRKLSGGNMQKIILARSLERAPKLILANQPIRGLDVGAAAYVHEKLLEARARGAAILLISEDLEELLALSDRISVMYHGHLSPPKAVEEVEISELGLLMSGQGHPAGKDSGYAA
ncbi:ABC transporter ATP-binding protein [Rhodovibrionaceae bacterium A322]